MDKLITEGQSRSNPYLNRVNIVQGDIAAQNVDAIVSVLPQNLDYRGQINAALREGAGAGLDEFLKDNIIRPRAGDLYAVPGFGLPCRHVFFCVVPVWRDDFDRHDRFLLNAVRRAMETANDMNLRSIALPPLASGRHGYPKARAARLILQGIADRLDDSIKEVRIVCRTKKTASIFHDRIFMMNTI